MPPGRPKSPSGPGVSVRIDAEIARKCKFIASEDHVSIAEYIAGLIGDRVDADYIDRVEKLRREVRSN